MPAGNYNLERLRAEIDAYLAAYLQTAPDAFGVDLSANGLAVLERLREFAMRPGKRIRGALAMVAYDMFGGTNRRAALDLALAVELIQNYLLIVDDVMDRSDLRRGGLALHRQYQQVLQHEYDTAEHQHLGNMIGVNAGLIDHHLSMLVLSCVPEAPERIVRAQQLFQANIAATGFGQIDDLLNEAGQDLTLDSLRHMYMLKSSYYSFVNPLQLGAVLAGAPEAVLEPIKRLGEQAGLAFQLQDDLLGMFGDTRATGKSSMDDLREGKRTLLIRHGLAHADAGQKHVLQAALGNKSVTPAQHREVQRILIATGSRDYVTGEAAAAAAVARGVLEQQMDWPAPGREFLQDLLNFVVNRER